MIQILGIREYVDTRDGKTKKAERFFEKNWRAESVEEVLQNPDRIVSNIPEQERYNLYFTVAECVEEKGRKLLVQKIIPFDIDGIDRDKAREVWFAACEALGVTPENAGAVFSGNGVWLFFKSPVEITEDSYFDQTRLYYKELCHQINLKLKAKGLKGAADPTSWSAARLARLPNTKNIKPGKEDVVAQVLNSHIGATLDVVALSGLPVLSKEDQLDQHFMRGYPSPDAKEILSERGCGYLSWCKENPDDVSEAQWYAMLGILDWLPDGRRYSHEYSRPYKGYSFEETERKADQAKANSGPRTCKNINGLWGKCASCKHFNKITSPIQIRGADFIVTEKTGFWSYKETKDGHIVLNKPEVMDLVKYFKRNHIFVTVPDSQEIYVYNGKMWEQMPTYKLQQYALDRFNPAVPTHVMDEFKKIILLINTVDADWFHRTTTGKFNLANGVFDMQTGKLLPHGQEYGFTHVLPYEYDIAARCPTFDSFMDEITLKRKDLQELLLEYAGYALSNDSCWLQRSIILTGEGANGKSTFAEVLRGLAGEDNCSSVRLDRIGNPIYNAQMERKLFNISEESSTKAFYDTQDFKELVAGGHITVKKLYQNQYTIENRTKLVIMCNELPLSPDGSHGFLRRLSIIPFDRTFSESERDIDIVRKLRAELSGIFNKVVESYRRLKEKGHLTEGMAAKAALSRYLEDTDMARLWISESFEVKPDAPKEDWVDSTTVYQEYVQNCNYDWGVKPVSSIQFTRALSRALKVDARDLREQVRISGKRMRVFKNVVRKEFQDEQF